VALEGSVLSTEEFRGFAKGVVPFLHVTSHVEGEKYGNLLQEKGGTGFPHVVAMDADGGVLAELDDRTVEGFQAMMKSGGDFTALLAKKDRTSAEEVDLLTREIGLGRVKAEDARTRAAAIKGLDDAGKARLDGLLLGLDIKGQLDKTNGRDPASRAATGKVFAEWWKAGRAPGGKDESFQPFFVLMLDHADASKDVALFEKVLGVLRDEVGSNPRAAGFFKAQEKRLEKLKADAAPTAEPPKDAPPRDEPKKDEKKEGM
jgi:hypothetical protein